MPPPLWPIYGPDDGMLANYQSRLNASGFKGFPEGRRKASNGGEVGETEPIVTDPHSFSDKDAVFFVEVLPVVTEVLAWMSLMNLLTCGVRFFAFSWSRMPMILAFALEGNDEEGEDGRKNPDMLPDENASDERQSDGFFKSISSLNEHGVDSAVDVAAVAQKGVEKEQTYGGAFPAQSTHAPLWCVESDVLFLA